MKKTVLALASIFIMHTVIAQVKLAAKAGWNFSTARAVYSDVKQSTDFAFGYGAGVMAKIPFDGVLHFSPSVMLNKRGFIINPDTGSIKQQQFAITYVDILPTLSLDFPHKANAFVISFGPNFSFSNWGKLKTTANNNATASQKLKFGYADYGWFDLGLNIAAAYHLKKIFVELGYMAGMANINNNEETDHRNIRNRMLSLNVGYYIK